MCGISGFINHSNNFSKRKLNHSALMMANKLEKRGPDSFGFWSDPYKGISMSHRRLAILDLTEKASQPMVSHSGRYILVYNGEIYNFLELRKIVEKRKINLRSQSDTEVLLELIAIKGIHKATELLNGIFSFSVWDRMKSKLFIVRDRVGVKPVYIYWDNKNFAFASEIKAIRTLPWLNFELDLESVASYVRLNYIPTPFSIFKNIFKLEPGSILEFDKRKIKISKFWSVDKCIETNEVSDSSQTFDIIKNAVKRQMVSDVPVGVFLSGGIDSSIVTSMAQSSSSKPINTFTIGFREDDFNEAKYAKKIANYLGTNHNEVFFGYDSIKDLLDIVPQAYDEPFSDSSQLPTLLLSKITKKKVKVALSGDGGDELFAGYYRYFLAHKFNNYIFKQPVFLKKVLKKMIDFIPVSQWNKLGIILPNSLGGKNFGDKLSKMSNLIMDCDEMSFQRRIISNCDNLSHHINKFTEKQTKYFDNSLENKFGDIIERMQYLDFQTYLPDDILVKVDRASMNFSLEVRVPLLDNEVVSHAWRLPKKDKVVGTNGKVVLKSILKKFLPSSLIDRPKMGFGVPLDKILVKYFNDNIEHYLNSKTVEQQKIFNLPFYKVMWEEHKSKKKNWQFVFWNFLVFQKWYNHWND